MRRRNLFAGLFTILAVLLTARLVLAIPPTPFQTYGTVKLDGENVPEGTIIRAYCGSDAVPSGQDATTFYLGDSFYTIQVAGDEAGTPEDEGCEPGQTVNYTIAYQGGEVGANETTTWVSGASDELNLTAEKPRPEIAVKKLLNDEDISAAPGPYILVGETVTWTYTISNTGNVVLTDVSLIDDQGTPGNPDDDVTVCTFPSLNPDGQQGCQLVNTAAAGQYSNQATVSAFYTQTVSAVDSSFYFGAIVAVDLEKYTNDQDADTAPGVYIAAGQPVTWTYVVSNTGNVALSNAEIVDDQLGAICTISNMLPGDPPATCSVFSTAGSGQYANLAAVTANAPAESGLPAAEDSDASHYFGVETMISLAKKTNNEDADSPPGPYVLAGGPVNWAYVVQNDSNVQLSNVQVTDNLVLNIDCQGVSALGPGEQMTCTATGTAVEGQYMNLGAVIGAPPGGLAVVSDTNSSHYFGARPEIQIKKLTNGQDANQPPGVYIYVDLDQPTTPVTWTYIISNTGNVTLTNAVVTDDMNTPDNAGDDLVICTVSVLAPGDPPVSCTAKGAAQLGQYANVGSVEALPPGGLAPVANQDASHYFGANPVIELQKRTNGLDADSGTGPIVLVGGRITWTYTISNTGNVILTGITVSDDQLGVVCEIASLAPGDPPATCEASGTAETGQYSNLGLAEGTPPGGLAPVSATDPSHYYGAEPALDLEKWTNGQDADSGPGPFILVGERVTWTFSVENSGNISLTNVVVTDDQLGRICDIALLVPGDAPATCTAGGTAATGPYANLGTAEGSPLGGLDPVGDSDASHYYGASPAVTLEKSTNQQDADSGTGPYILVGDPVTWTFTVENSGNVDLENVEISDDRLGSICTASFLAAGDPPISCSVFGTAQPDQYENLGRVEASYEGVVVSDTDPSRYFGALTEIDLEKHTDGVDADDPPGPYILAGDSVTWTFMVTNNGNVVLNNVTITDDGGTPGDLGDDHTCDFAELLPGHTKSCQKSALAQTGQFANSAVATGTPPGGLPDVGDADDSHYFGSTPSIVLEKRTNGFDVSAPPGPYVLNGDPVAWTYAITNTGNVTLTIISVTDDQGLNVECPATSSLGPDESILCQASDAAGVGQYQNVGTVVAAPPGDLGEVSAADTSYYFGAQPAIALKKLTNGQDADGGPGPYIWVGDTVTWTFVVTNTGNVTLTNIIVSDDNGTPDILDDDIVSDDQGSLPAQASTIYTLTGAAHVGPYTNVGSVRAKPLIGDDVSASSASSYFGATIDLRIKKFTNGEDAPAAPGPIIEAGEAVTWTYVISASGNIDLSDVVIQDDNGTPDEPAD
ncbi:MAG: hypothetical protein PVJ75_11690, partial [Chloroflexota bacterium]